VYDINNTNNRGQDEKVKLVSLSLIGSVLVMSGCGGDDEPVSETTVVQTDYDTGVRTAAATPGDAEYHTGTGFNHTLFDSADQKCQHCHNELYDTWKGSMHGKSWSDPIYQSKFQDFLRTQLAKIGETKAILYEQNMTVGTNVGGTKNMFTSAAQTCIKCHAPGAFYAGDLNITVSEVQDISGDINATTWAALKTAEENVTSPTTHIEVIAANAHTNKVYKATFQIGHEANREGINCAFCHSIETPRMMGLTQDNSAAGYTLAKDLRFGPHGPVNDAAGVTLAYDINGSTHPMNAFFKLVGPEKYTDYNSTSKAAGTVTTNRTADGRYTMTSKDINGTNGKVHYTGGPFYGPFGVTGTRNENTDDETNRTALVHPDFNATGNNHFGGGDINGDHGKALCLSCHQRSAGAKNPETGGHMELCTTWNATTAQGTNTDTPSDLDSPKCQKCHMERIQGTLLH
jgi:hypothetical protein